MEIGRGRYDLSGTYNTHQVSGDNIHQLDITKREETFSLLGKIKPDCVINTAAVTDLEFAEAHPEETWAVNVEGTKNLAEACEEIGAKIIFISTDQVFDGTKQTYAEDDTPRPLNYYAKTKVIAERVLDALAVDYLICRTAGLYGINGRGKLSFASWVIQKLSAGESINCVSDQFNNPTFADNLAEMVYSLYDKKANGVFHTSGADFVSRYELARKTAEIFGLDLALIKAIPTSELKWIAKRPEKANMSKEKLVKIGGAKPLSLSEGLSILKKQLEVRK